MKDIKKCDACELRPDNLGTGCVLHERPAPPKIKPNTRYHVWFRNEKLPVKQCEYHYELSYPIPNTEKEALFHGAGEFKPGKDTEWVGEVLEERLNETK